MKTSQLIKKAEKTVQISRLLRILSRAKSSPESCVLGHTTLFFRELDLREFWTGGDGDHEISTSR